MIGVKKDFDESFSEGEHATFEAIAVAPDGTLARRARASHGRSIKVDNDYQWFNSDGHWSYEPVKSSQARSPTATIDIAADRSGENLARRSAGAAIGSTSSRPTAKRPASPSTSAGRARPSADTPDNVVVTLDKANYAPGDEAKLRIASRFAGKATIALVGDKLEQFIDVDLVEGDNVVPFKVGGDWGAGAYAVALTHRPLDVKAKRMPGRALGLAWFAHRRRRRTSSTSRIQRARHGAAAPDAERADQDRRPCAGRRGARSTVAAVDVGILNLTGYQDARSRAPISSASASCRSRFAISTAC